MITKQLIPVIILSVGLSFVFSCTSRHTLFEQIAPEESGIHFNNIIIENDSINPMDLTNVYNGGGVGVGDFNNDGWLDLYFTGNLVENKLYLNNGNFRFTDITHAANVTGEGRWCRGVAVIDINNDGRLDLYVAASMLRDGFRRQNLLYINQGADRSGIPQFTEMAAAYGLNDTTHTTMPVFFDYDNDGDLDVYLVVNEIRLSDNPSVYRPRVTDGSHYSTGRLYRNDWNDSLQHAFFTNVTMEAGLTTEGYGHAATIADFNRDGWKDIFVTNDFLGNDLLYINNRNGTFTDKTTEYFKHTAANGMGQDVIDINNDGLSDVIELDMNPEDNYRKKMMLNANNYSGYQNADYYGYQYQYVRNTLQVNCGFRVLENDSIGDPVFADIAWYAGIAETDWSWAPLVQDFDNDGWRDIIVTNGYPKDVTDHDFMAFRNRSSQVATKEFLLQQIPQVKIHNYAFRNNGDLTFSNTTEAWGLSTPSFSNGGAYADLDNDGDLDLVINNINDEAMVYRNVQRERDDQQSHFLRIRLHGDSLNRMGLGTWIELHYGGNIQAYEQTTARGYLSSIQPDVHFGLGAVTSVDSLCIKWPDGKMQVLRQVSADQLLTVAHTEADNRWSPEYPRIAPLFHDITRAAGIQYVHRDEDFVDFNIQKLLPHKLSEYGPALAAGDLDGNGLDDLVVGGSRFYSAQLFLQHPSGAFVSRALLPDASEQTKLGEDMGIVLFDADNDHDLDIYITSGGYENESNGTAYADKLFVNNGKGVFTIDSTALPANYTSKSCVRAADFDKDGDLDLFVAGRVEPGAYPKPVSSAIYRNDSRPGKIAFTDVTSTAAPMLNNIGLIADAIWTDFNNDGWQDLVLAGEWMPLTFLQNVKGNFRDVTAGTGLQQHKGWWNSIVSGDFDNDGDMDYVAGNLGLNSFYKASDRYPVRMYAKDFDKNGSYDAVPALYLPSSMEDKTKKEFVAHTRDDMIRQLIGFRAKYPRYKTYANATVHQMFSKEELQDALVVEANNFSHCYIKNLGNGKFACTPLPATTQWSCLNGMVVDDINYDGNADIIINGNDYSTDVGVGRYDGCNGLLLRGRGDGTFEPASITESGLFIPGNGKALVKLRSAHGHYLLAAGQHRGPLKLFALKAAVHCVSLSVLDETAVITYKNGKTQLRDLQYGASFLSQPGRFMLVDDEMAQITITNSKGEKRIIR